MGPLFIVNVSLGWFPLQPNIIFMLTVSHTHHAKLNIIATNLYTTNIYGAMEDLSESRSIEDTFLYGRAHILITCRIQFKNEQTTC